MTESIPLIDLIPYDEMFHILHDKFKVTHQEVRYWIKNSLNSLKFNIKSSEDGDLFLDPNNFSFSLIPYVSDLPVMNMYEYPSSGFFYPDCYFYDRQSVLSFIPKPPLRFVYQKDLTAKRNWSDYRTRTSPTSSSLISQTLLQANEFGILCFYNAAIDEFTTHANENQIWYQTFEGEECVSNPESFFLLHEILNIERVFFKRDRRSCLAELELITDDLPPNVYKFNKK